MNYMSVVPDSHMWTDLEMLIRTLEYQKKSHKEGMSYIKTRDELIDYLITGLNNCIKQGYELRKQEVDVVPEPVSEAVEVHSSKNSCMSSQQNFQIDYLKYFDKSQQPCLHDSCPECHGTGHKGNGGLCFHYISCPCPKCTWTC